jgi:hypothetical protein
MDELAKQTSKEERKSMRDIKTYGASHESKRDVEEDKIFSADEAATILGND